MMTILFDTGQTPKTFFTLLWPAVGPNTPVQLQRGANKVWTGRGGGVDGEVRASGMTSQKGEEKKENGTRSLSFSHKARQAFDCSMSERDSRQLFHTWNHFRSHTRGGHASGSLTRSSSRFLRSSSCSD